MTSLRPFHLLLISCGLLLAVFLLTPILGLLLANSPAALLRQMLQAEVLQAVRVTLLTSAAALPLIFLFGLPAAYGLSRCRGKLRKTLELLLELPMVMPPVVAGLAMLLAFGRNGLLGEGLATFGVRIPFSPLAVVLGTLFVVTPFFVRRCTVLFDGIDPKLEEAALTLGASPLQTFWHVTLPVIRRGLFAEAVMALTQGIGLFGVIILFAGNLPGRTQTLSLAIYSAFSADPQQAFALGALLLLISLVLLTIAHLLAPQEERL